MPKLKASKLAISDIFLYKEKNKENIYVVSAVDPDIVALKIENNPPRQIPTTFSGSQKVEKFELTPDKLALLGKFLVP